jgi:hypothetical protein
MVSDKQNQPKNPAASIVSTPEDLREGYTAAVQMAIYDGQLSWQVTGVYLQLAFLLVAGSIFPAFVGSTNQTILSVTSLLVSIAGLGMTAMFGSMVMRMRTYEMHWVNCATTLEEKLGDEITTFKGAQTLASGGKVITQGVPLKINANASVKSKQILKAFFGGFLLTFLLLFVFNLGRVILGV